MGTVQYRGIPLLFINIMDIGIVQFRGIPLLFINIMDIGIVQYLYFL